MQYLSSHQINQSSCALHLSYGFPSCWDPSFLIYLIFHQLHCGRTRIHFERSFGLQCTHHRCQMLESYYQIWDLNMWSIQTSMANLQEFLLGSFDPAPLSQIVLGKDNKFQALSKIADRVCGCMLQDNLRRKILLGGHAVGLSNFLKFL